jgi:LCP family protein required for cell wall assembly
VVVDRTPRRYQLTAAAAAVVVGLVAAAWAPAALDSALAQTLRRNDVGSSELDRPVYGQPIVFLVIGSDRREGLPDELPRIGAHTGERADVVMLWLVDVRARTIRGVSLSRYLRVDVTDHGEQMLAGALEYGDEAVVAAVRSLVDIPIHHYVKLDFAGLHDIVNVLGGVTLRVPRPARDPVTHLDLQPGEQHLDADAVLAYVRSRHYEELRYGRWEPVDTGDDGRIRRQYHVIAAVVDRLRAVDGLDELGRLLLAVGRHVTVDGTLRPSELAGLRQVLSAEASPRTELLPTRPEVPPAEAISPFPPTHAGTVGFRLPSEPGATVLLHELRSSVMEPG